MNDLKPIHSHLSTSILGSLLFIILSLFPDSGHAQFQKIYGTPASNSYSRVIPYGSDFYVLGTDNGQATITRIDQLGNWMWTTGLNIPSEWTDGIVILGSGNLLVVGFTLPFDHTNKSLIGEIMPNGTFICVKSLDGPGNEALNRISSNPGGSYTAVGFHTSVFREVVIYDLSANCTVNSKKRFFSFANDFFDNDLEVFSGSGDFVVAGSLGANAIIYRVASGGLFVSGAQGPGLFNYVDLAKISNGDILAAANSTGTNPPRLVRFDTNLFPVWEVTVNGITSLEQVVSGGNGNIYVVGTVAINNLPRAVIIKINDSSGPPVLDWARFMDSGESGYTGGSIAALSSGDLAFVDGRDGHISSFGQTDAFMSVTNDDLESGCTQDAFAFLSFENTLFDGPPVSELLNTDPPQEITLLGQNLYYMMATACASDTCDVEITYTLLDNCGMVQLCANATGPQPYSYQWCDGQSFQCVTTQLSCGAQSFCVSVTCGDGSTASDSLTINTADNVPPVALCAPGFGIELDANCEFIITPALIDGGSSDNCQIDSMSVSPKKLIGCGIHQVVLTVTDWCGNTSSCVTSIQAAEFDPPSIICPPDLTFNCDDDVSPNTTGVATATDICDPNPVITYSDIVSGILPCNGTIQRSWTATDSCGNFDTCLQLITFKDNIPPTAFCNTGVTVYLGNPCSVTITPAMMDAGSTDNCQIQSLTVSPNIVTQCGTPLITMTVTDSCGNTATCQETITVLDTIPPTIFCPQDIAVTAFYPNCESVVHNIQAGATDNCTIQAINYTISGASSGSGSGDASGELFQEGISTVSYTVMDGCGNVDSCSFIINVECDTCSCLGFTNLYFDNFNPFLAVSCDSASVELPCIGNDGLYSLQWTLLCSDPLCPQSVDYQIVAASGGPALLSGTAPFPFLSFAYNQLAGPGNYQLILTGDCSGDTCICVVNFSLMECCDCGSFSGMTYQPAQDSLILPVMCGDTLAVICDQLSDLEINGIFQCQGSQCLNYPVLNWELKDPTDTPFQSGTVQTFPGFNLALTPAWFTNPGLYTLTISGQCGGETCPPCVVYFESEGCIPPPENCCFEWATETIGGQSSSTEITTDAAGNVYTTGYFSGTVDFDPGSSVYNLTSSSGLLNIFVLKLDPSGNFVWASSFGPGQGIGWSIAADSAGNIYVAGWFENTCDFDPGPAISNLTAHVQDGFWMKLDATGNLIWAKQIKGMTNSSGNWNQIFDITIDALGNIYSTGRFFGLNDFDPGLGIVTLPGSSQCFVTKLDNNGNFIWARHLERNNIGSSQGWSLSVDAAGNVYITGLFWYSVDFDPSSNVFYMTSTGFQEIFIFKLDPAGIFVWAKQIEGTPGQHQHSGPIRIDPSGDVIVGGSFELTADFDPGPNIFTLSASRNAFVLKLDHNGKFVWVKQIGATATGSTSLLKALDFDANENIYTSGQFWGVNDFDPGPNVYYYATGGVNTGNAFILKLDSSGTFIWAKFLEGTGFAEGSSIAISQFGDIYTSGRYTRTIDFNPGTSVLNFTTTNGAFNQFIHKLGACLPDSCRSPVYSINRYEPCRYRFQVETIDDCYPSLRLQLDTSMFVSWNTDIENGWLAEEISSTEILLTHNSGSIPLGASIPIEFELSPGLNPNLTIHWDNSCESVQGCASSLLLAGCHVGCNCGSFSDLFIRSPQDTLSQPVTCGGPPLNIACPTPGIGYTLTGSLLCMGDSCRTELDLDWNLVGPFGGLLASGTIQAAPWFNLSMPSSYFSQAGVYTLILNGYCGTETCLCFIEFLVEEGCPDPCPCDLMELQADAKLGFASTLWDSSCKGCFSPLGLNDCDELEWYVNNPTGTHIGTSIGNQSLCHTFPGAGVYTVDMVVTRRGADGVICGSFTRSQTIHVTCQVQPDCDDSILPNASFSEGALAGPMNDMGASEGWDAIAGNPAVIEETSGSLDGWTIQLTGNYDGADVLSLLEPICLEQDTGTISLHLRLFPWGDPHIDHKDKTKWDFKAKFYQGDNFEIDHCDSTNCLQLASIDLSPFDTGWANLKLPYDISGWDVQDLCNGVLVRPAIYVTNSFGDGQGGEETQARLQLDNFCLNGVLVGTDNVNNDRSITLYPNPTTGQLILRFENNIPENGEIQILDIWGRTVRLESLIPGLRLHNMDLRALPTSVYIIKVMEDGNPVWLEKIILL